MATKAYQRYMELASRMYKHLSDGTEESASQTLEIEKEQTELWEKMTDEERLFADENILRTALYLKGKKR